MIAKGDEWLNEATRAWFRVTKIETTKSGEIVRFTFGLEWRNGKRTKVGQSSKPLAEFLAAMRGLRKVKT